ncbi:tripartite tricarboxylate transporter permease [Roseomonas sp. HF4]|uniref:tripartite tricarboxylate transporter permease n=1 Tax=Roseomonas sp. HF4 TaxID=2562313 RepID=UPI0010C08D17|nr:tripartite tricarboxylate transporter permease [Roseomonas sp. HF4]
MMDVILGALFELLTPERMMFMMLGVSVGLVIGVLPGLGGIAGLSLLLPFIYGMDPTSALAMLIGLVAVIPTSDTFSSILMGIPGSSASQATVLDGFPLAQKGEGARALSAAFFASMIGGFFGAIVLTASVLAARPIILLFGSAELFMLTLFGLSTVAALSGGNLAKGVASACLGLAFGMIGAAPATGEYRMDFDTLYLSDGVPLVIVGLGIFALPELFNLLRGGGAIAQHNPMGTGWIQGVKDVLKNPWLVLRCSGIGALIGAIPGIGGSVVDWIAYSHAMQTTKDTSQFGKGEIRGVIAPESANNATQGGALLPTLLFGIPGSGSMAIFLAGMILIGLQPGPAMADRNLDVTYTIIWSLAIANFVGTLLCIALAPGIAKLTTIRYALIAPFMIMVISFAAFQATRSVYDLMALFAVGILGLFLRRFGWSRPAFLIGFVLSLGAERYLYQAVQFSGWEFVTRPVALVILALTALSLWAGLRRSQSNVNTEGAADESRATSMLPQVAFTGLLLVFFGWVILEGLKNSYLAALMPVVVGSLGAAAVLLVLVFQARGATTAGTTNFDQEASATDNGPWPFVGWALGFLALTLLVGFFAALAMFFVAFLRVVARCGWVQTLLLTAAACGFLLILASSLNLIFPGGLLQEHYDLPWPLR